MASEHKAIEADVRRRSETWDRLKFLVLITVFLGFMLVGKINTPFTGFLDAVEETWASNFGRFLMIVFPIELLRQLHYFVSEKSARYNSIWADKVFGGFERQTHKRLKPWTRFRLGRYVRIAIYLLILGTIIDYFVAEVSNPVDALINGPRIALSGLSRYFIFLMYPLLLISQFGLLFWFLSRGGVDTVMPEEIKTRYSDVWGQDHVLELVAENVGFLEKPDLIESKGGYIPGGMLLWGPPGTGKTLMAEATAGEVGVPFVFVDPGAFINMFMGVGILKVKGLFRKLRKISLRHGGVVVFFDEADALGSRGAVAGGGPPDQPATPHNPHLHCNGMAYLSSRALDIIGSDHEASTPEGGEAGESRWINRIMMGMGGGGGGGMGTLQALLTEMSGLTKPRGISNRIRKRLGMKPKPAPKYRIFIMMATNMPNVLDPALLRPGRIDRIYRVGYPTKEGRLTTFNGYLGKVEHELTEKQIDDLALKTPYYSGAKIKDIVNEALILALRDDRSVITWEDVWKAKTLKEMGPAEGFEYVEREEFAIAIHEAGHAVSAHLLRAHADIDIATIERRGEIGGFVSSIALEDRFTQWKTELELDVKVALASLAVERMFFEGDNSMGVGGDLRTATTVVSRMVGVWGMGDNIASMTGLPKHALDQPPDPTEEISSTMRSQIERRLRAQYDEVYQLMEDHKSSVYAVAKRLQEKKTIAGSEVAEIIGLEAGSITTQNPVGFGKVTADEHGRALGFVASTEVGSTEVEPEGQRDAEAATAVTEPEAGGKPAAD